MVPDSLRSRHAPSPLSHSLLSDVGFGSSYVSHATGAYGLAYTVHIESIFVSYIGFFGPHLYALEKMMPPTVKTITVTARCFHSAACVIGSFHRAATPMYSGTSMSIDAATEPPRTPYETQSTFATSTNPASFEKRPL